MRNDLHIIVGLGATGMSCAKYLQDRSIPFAVTDNRLNPPYLTQFKTHYPHVPLSLGKLDRDLLDKAVRLIVSPGLSLKDPAIMQQIIRGVPIVGDIELFAQEVKVPVIAITGTNAKSTVTMLVYEMIKAAGLDVRVGGNLGTPALDLLNMETQVFVLEISSYQLETTHSLAPTVASLLNVTPDHMDRYATFAEYAQVKRQIYKKCKIAVCNKDDPLTDCGTEYKKQKFYFTLNTPENNTFGLLKKDDEVFLAYENEALLNTTELPILGRHYQANALAALAIGYSFGLEMDPMLETLMTYKGLPHRCQLVCERRNVRWYNDSKGTNVGATLAAIEGLGNVIRGKLILIAGGIGKNADFSPLILPIEKYVKKVILIGEAAPVIASVLADRVAVVHAPSMEEAVALADQSAAPGDSVLLSPACASFDMFNNFEHRGQVFIDYVNKLGT